MKLPQIVACVRYLSIAHGRRSTLRSLAQLSFALFIALSAHGQNVPQVEQAPAGSQAIPWTPATRKQRTQLRTVLDKAEVKAVEGSFDFPTKVVEEWRGVKGLERDRVGRWMQAELDALKKVKSGEPGIYGSATYRENLSEMLKEASVARPFIFGGEVVPANLHTGCVGFKTAGGRIGSGVLVSDRVIVTAGHLHKKADSIEEADPITEVCFGTNLASPQYKAKVIQEIPHENFRVVDSGDYEKYRHDLCLLIVEKTVPPNWERVQRVRSGKLTPQNFTSVQVVGFGHTNQAGTTGWGTKRYTDVPIRSFDCSDDRIGGFPEVEFSAGKNRGERDTCKGDSGGPALWQEDGRWLLAGTTSRLTKDHRPNVQCGDGGIYVKMEFYNDWIDQVIAANPPRE
jgi:hypothetical protein